MAGTVMVSVLVQVFCIVSIAYIKVKYLLEERKRMEDNASGRIDPTNDVDKDSSPAVRNLNFRPNAMRVKELTNNDLKSTLVQRKSDENNSVLLNTTAYNKILVEVYQLAFFTIAMPIVLASAVVKGNLRINGVGEHSHILLCFLDLAPRILVSIVLPITVHACNPEIRRYIKRSVC